MLPVCAAAYTLEKDPNRIRFAKAKKVVMGRPIVSFVQAQDACCGNRSQMFFLSWCDRRVQSLSERSVNENLAGFFASISSDRFIDTCCFTGTSNATHDVQQPSPLHTRSPCRTLQFTEGHANTHCISLVRRGQVGTQVEPGFYRNSCYS